MNTTTINPVQSASITQSEGQPCSELRYLSLQGQPTPTELEWAADNLFELPTVVHFDRSLSARNWQDADGVTYRKAGNIIASPGSSANRFRINLFDGATDIDLAWFERRIEEARRGLFTGHGWQPLPSGSYRFSWSRMLGVNEAGNVLVECTESACAEFGRWHAGDGDDRTWFTHAQPPIGEGPWRITVERWSTAARWSVDVYMEGDDTLSPEQAASLASDVRWAAADCRKLNALP